MKLTGLFFLVTAIAIAGADTAAKAERSGHVLILTEVTLNGKGPFRMIVDTGNASSAVRPSVARQLGLHPTFAVEQVTASGSRTVPVAQLDEVRVGGTTDDTVEVMIADVQVSGVDGVLGQSWLVRHDYLLDYRNRHLVLDGAAPQTGVRADLRSDDGRPMIAAEVDGRRQDLVVDSGASALILFGRPSVNRQAALFTNDGSATAETGSARVAIGSGYRRTLDAAWVSASARPGLLPAAAFRAVYVSNREGVVVLVP